MQFLGAKQAERGDAAEEMLVRRSAAGDAEAFADLYDRLLDRVFRYFYYRVANRQEAEDLTEQVFLKAWQALPKYDQGRAPFSAWVFRVAYNLLVDRHRINRETAPLDDTVQIEDRGDSPEELVARRLESSELAGAIGKLSAVEQTIIILRFVEGLDHRTVAGIIGKSEVATRSIQSRALVRLARLLEPRESVDS